MYEKENNVISIISAFAIGGLIGAGLALLMAPQSGQETRNQIKNRTEEMRGKAVETAEQTRHKAEKAINEIADQTKQKVDDVRKRGQETADKTRINY